MAVVDLVIRGGTLIDGLGTPGRPADVAIQGGRIVELGKGLRGRRELDASGQIVCPGFIDIHTHYDAQVFWDPGLTPSAYHGVTTVIAGNCGFSIAPTRPGGIDLLARTLEHVEDMSFETLREGVPWDEFETFPQYLDAVEQRGVTLNFACYVGHTAVRLYAMGEEAYERVATRAEVTRMQAIVADALVKGAVGFASSAGPAHNGDKGRPVPSRLAEREELLALMLPLRDQNRGVVALVPGQAIPHEEIFRLQGEIKRPFTWTALLAWSGNPHQEIVARHNAARAQGIEVWPQISCRPLVFQITLEDPFNLNGWDSFKQLAGTTFDERMASYGDPCWRERAQSELGSSGQGARSFSWDSMWVSETEAHPEWIGSPVVELAREKNCSPLDFVLDLSMEDRLTTRYSCVLANDDPQDVAWLLQQDNVLIGLADSGAHVSQLCDACFTSDLLGTWVRSRRVMSIERAVYKLTAEPARVFGLRDRGSIEVGKAADVCVFDPDAIAPGPLRRIHDFPASGERLVADAPAGISHVVVNGIPIKANGLVDSQAFSSSPGRVLRHFSDALGSRR